MDNTRHQYVFAQEALCLSTGFVTSGDITRKRWTMFYWSEKNGSQVAKSYISPMSHCTSVDSFSSETEVESALCMVNDLK